MKSSLEILASTSPKRLLTYRETATKILALETQLGIAPSKPILHIWRANERVSELEAMVVSKNAAPLPNPIAVAPTASAAPSLSALTGRDRFLASCARDAAAKPQAKSHPELYGRDRFSADVRLDATPQILTANQKPIADGLKGRERFKAALAKDFGSK